MHDLALRYINACGYLSNYRSLLYTYWVISLRLATGVGWCPRDTV